MLDRSKDEIDKQFDLRRRHRLARLHLVRNAIESRLAQRELRCELDVAYGESEGQKLDIFPAGAAGAPVFVFIHGGYFRALGQERLPVHREPMVRSGFTVVLVNYDLAPRVRISEIVRQVRSSFEWFRANVRQWNGDPGSIVLCGHSVGSFLAARVLEADWPGGSGIQRTALLSGLYDLGPLQRSYLNSDLRLSQADVPSLNPRADAMAERPDILVAVGAAETREFVTQSQDYSRRLTEATIDNELMVLPRVNHYTMARLLARKRNPVMDWITDSEAPDTRDANRS